MITPSNYSTSNDFQRVTARTQNNNNNNTYTHTHTDTHTAAYTAPVRVITNHVYNAYVRKQTTSHTNIGNETPGQDIHQYGTVSPAHTSPPQTNLTNVLMCLDANALRSLVYNLSTSFNIKHAIQRFYSAHIQNAQNNNKEHTRTHTHTHTH